MPSLIGNKPNQVPSNGDLGTLAFQDSNAVNLTGGTAVLSSVVSDSLTADAINLKVDTDISNIAPSLNLDFANSKTLDPRITFTRASTATFYDGVTTAKAEENLLLQSETFDNASWTKSNATVTANSTAAPSGATTAELVYPTTTGTFRGIFQAGTSAYVNTAVAKVFSIYAKASGISHIYLVDAQNGAQRTWFNVSTGTVGTTAASHTASIVDVGNGWYRCIVSTSIAWASNAAVGWIVADADNSNTATTSGTNGVFLWGAQLEQRSAVSAYTPTTTAPITNYIPVLRTAASGVPRFEHNPITGESLGLEIEESRANLLLQSEDFSTTWATTTGAISTNLAIAPDGTLTADKFVPDTSSIGHFVSQSVTTTAVAHTYSIYAKAGEYGFVQLYHSQTARARAFNLTDGTLGVSTATAPDSSQITPVGNGWYRCSITVTATAASNGWRIYASDTNTIIKIFAGDGFSGLYLWGAQLEAGAFATSYIPTVASQVTRAADAASMTGTNFSSWYNFGQGSLYAEASCPLDSSNSDRTIACITGVGSMSNGWIIRFAGTLKVAQTYGSNNGAANQWVIANNVNYSGLSTKMAVGYNTNDVAFSNASTLVGTDTLALLGAVDTFYIGQQANGLAFLNSTIKKLQYFPRRLPNAELVEITS